MMTLLHRICLSILVGEPHEKIKSNPVCTDTQCLEPRRPLGAAPAADQVLDQAIAAGFIGEVVSANFTLHWDHNWIIGTPFEEIYDLILYDFGVHWFDMAACFFGQREARRVQASTVRGISQKARPPMLASALIEFEGGIASLHFNANVTHGQQDRTYIAGTRGSIESIGPSLSEQAVTLYTADGFAKPDLQGTWFLQGFHGTMAELLCAIEENREPINNARDNLRGLALCFA